LLTEIARWAVGAVYSFGYLGVFVLTALGNMNLLIPTQMILPLAGFLVGQGRFSLILVLVASTAGSVAGSLILYLLGLWSGGSLRKLIKRFERFNSLVFRSDLDKAGKVFERHGREAVLIGRFTPGLGALISLLAGIERMKIWQFTVYTALGSALWNGGLVGLGWALGVRWMLVRRYASIIEYVVLAAVIVVTILWFLWRRWKANAQPTGRWE
jgi:membrane protein DedA with SNARE-associated domain